MTFLRHTTNLDSAIRLAEIEPYFITLENLLPLLIHGPIFKCQHHLNQTEWLNFATKGLWVAARPWKPSKCAFFFTNGSYQKQQSQMIVRTPGEYESLV
ncbi:hypothetical protein TNCV_1264291 [Trichonephila clavipes]|nr:hypothetical protein TNCV_1264291 [Trichonephila clavipes]